MNITPEEFDRIMSEYSQEKKSDDVWVVHTTLWDFWCSLVISGLLEDITLRKNVP